MDATYPRDRKQGDQTIEIVKQILGLVLIKTANDHEDMHHNTDLLIKTPQGDPIRIAMRMRTASYEDIQDYKYEFTLCCYRGLGGDAEYQKIMGTGKDGKSYGDYMIYGFQDETGKQISFWVIIDLRKFKAWKDNTALRLDAKGDDPNVGKLFVKETGQEIGSCLPRKRTNSKTGEKYLDYFYAYKWKLIPGIVVADSESWGWNGEVTV